MGTTQSGILGGRLPLAEYEANFSDLHPSLDRHEALVAADRCYFCHDAPCMTACPTSIDIPLFIRQIATGNPIGSAKTIFDQNILGGMCARVCPTETLCEEACVRNTAEEQAGRDRPPAALRDGHRHAARTSSSIARALRFRPAESPSSAPGRPGLACAHRLAAERPRRGDLRGAAKNPAASTNTASPPTRRSTTSPRDEVEYVLCGRRHRGAATARRSAATSRLPIWPRIRCGVPRPRPCRRQCTADRRRECRRRRGRRRLHRRHFASRGPWPTSPRRPPRRRARRRHDGDRRGRPGEAARRRGSDDLLPPRQGAHERLRIRAGPRRFQGRRHPPLAAAEAHRRRRTARSPASSSTTPRSRTASSSTTGETCESLPPTRSSRRSARPSRPSRPRRT